MYTNDRCNNKAGKESITMNEINKFIDEMYLKAECLNIEESLQVSNRAKGNIAVIIGASENSKGVLAVTVTSLIYKCLNPQ